MVLDPFVGSGTTAISTKILKRNYIGFEMEKEYVQIARSRLSAYSTNIILYDARHAGLLNEIPEYPLINVNL